MGSTLADWTGTGGGGGGRAACIIATGTSSANGGGPSSAHQPHDASSPTTGAMMTTFRQCRLLMNSPGRPAPAQGRLRLAVLSVPQVLSSAHSPALYTQCPPRLFGCAA